LHACAAAGLAGEIIDAVIFAHFLCAALFIIARAGNQHVGESPQAMEAACDASRKSFFASCQADCSCTRVTTAYASCLWLSLLPR